MIRHFFQVGNPAPPLPRRPAAFTSSISASGVMAVSAFTRPEYPPTPIYSSMRSGSMSPQSRRTSFSWPLKKASSFQSGRKLKSRPNSTSWVRKSQRSIFASAERASLSKAASSATPLARAAARTGFTSVNRSTGLPGRYAITSGSAAQKPKQPTRLASASRFPSAIAFLMASSTSPAPLPMPQVPMPTESQGRSLMIWAIPSIRSAPRSFVPFMPRPLSSFFPGAKRACRWSSAT